MTADLRLPGRLGLVAVLLAAGAMVTDLTASDPIAEVTPVELGHWIRDRTPGLEVIDVRPQEDYEAGHIPGARRIPAPDLSTAGRSAGTVVLYDQDGTRIREAADAVAATDTSRVYVLQRGIDGWIEDVMAPRLRADATEEERAAFAVQAELSRWFGGLPRVVPAGAITDGTESAADRSKRLLTGC